MAQLGRFGDNWAPIGDTWAAIWNHHPKPTLSFIIFSWSSSLSPIVIIWWVPSSTFGPGGDHTVLYIMCAVGEIWWITSTSGVLHAGFEHISKVSMWYFVMGTFYHNLASTWIYDTLVVLVLVTHQWYIACWVGAHISVVNLIWAHQYHSL